MHIVIAPDSFKGSATAVEVAAALARGFRRGWPGVTVDEIPMADGGEGTVEALVRATGGRLVWREVTGPLGAPVQAPIGILGDGETAVIEMASASGLTLIPEAARNPLTTSTYGTGELMRAALDLGCRRLLVGIGGSATNDGGAGMAAALGAKLLDASGHVLPPGGAALARLARIDTSALDTRLRTTTVVVACDVDNPLLGPQGASHVYGPQKGATPEMMLELDAALTHYARIVARDLGKDVADYPGAGAAGGLGAGLLAFTGAQLRRGVEIVIDAVQLDRRVQAADLVVTGEGAIDRQTAFGKTPVGVAKVAKRFGKPVVAVSGTVGEGVEAVYDQGIDAVFSIIRRPMTLADAMTDAPKLLEELGEALARLLCSVKTLR